MTNIANVKHKKSHVTIRMVRSHLTLAYSRGQGQDDAHFDSAYLSNDYRLDKHCYCRTNSHVAVRLAYLQPTMDHSEGQGQGHAHFDCEYLANGKR